MKQMLDRDLVESMGGRLDQTNRTETIFYPGGGTTTLFRDVKVPGAIEAGVVRIVLETLRVSNSIDIANKDQDLSPSGKLNRRRALEVERAKVVKELDAADRYADDLTVLARIREETLYQAPPLEATDAAGALIDQEIRAYFRALTGEPLTQALNQLQAGQNPRQLEALMRSPIPFAPAIADLCAIAWEAHLETEEAAEVQAVTHDRDVAAWATGACAQLRTQLDKLAFFEPAGVLQAA